MLSEVCLQVGENSNNVLPPVLNIRNKLLFRIIEQLMYLVYYKPDTFSCSMNLKRDLFLIFRIGGSNRIDIC
jgi:hypothetical protein